MSQENVEIVRRWWAPESGELPFDPDRRERPDRQHGSRSSRGVPRSRWLRGWSQDFADGVRGRPSPWAGRWRHVAARIAGRSPFRSGRTKTSRARGDVRAPVLPEPVLSVRDHGDLLQPEPGVPSDAAHEDRDRARTWLASYPSGCPAGAPAGVIVGDNRARMAYRRFALRASAHHAERQASLGPDVAREVGGDRSSPVAPGAQHAAPDATAEGEPVAAGLSRRAQHTHAYIAGAAAVATQAARRPPAAPPHATAGSAAGDLDAHGGAL